MAGIAGIFERAGVPVQVQGVGPMFQFWFSDDADRRLPRRGRPPQLAEVRGPGARAPSRGACMVHPSNIELWFVSTVHTDADIDETLVGVRGRRQGHRGQLD